MQIFASLIAIFLTISFTAHSFDKAEDAALEKVAIKTAYAEYKAAVKLRDYENILKTAKAVYDLGDKRYSPTSKNRIKLTDNYVNALLINGQHKEAITYLSKKVEILKLRDGPMSEQLIETYFLMGDTYITFYKERKALDAWLKAIEISASYKDNSGRTGRVYLEVGKKLFTKANGRKALSYFKLARDIFEANDDVAGLTKTKFWLGKFYLAKNKLTKSEDYFKQSLEMYEKHAPGSDPLRTNHAFLVQVLEKQGKRDEATIHCQAIGKMGEQKPNSEMRPIYLMQPAYPRQANISGIEGWAEVTLTVDHNGFVKDPVVTETKGSNSFGVEALRIICISSDMI